MSDNHMPRETMPRKSGRAGKRQEGPFREAAGYEYDYLGKSASATDCTGLIPFGPTDQAQLDSYQDVYPFEVKAVVPGESEER